MSKASGHSDAEQGPSKKQKVEGPTFQYVSRIGPSVFPLPLTLISRDSTMITFTADSERKEFSMHKEVACFYSPVLAEIFNSGTTTYCFGSEEMTRRFVEWLYTQKLTVHRLHRTECIKDFCNVESIDEVESLMDIWSKAGDLKIPSLQDAAIESIDQIYRHRAEVYRHGWVFFAQVIDNIYENTKLWKYLAVLGAYASEDLAKAVADGDPARSAIYVQEVLRYAGAQLSASRTSYVLSDFLSASA